MQELRTKSTKDGVDKHTVAGNGMGSTLDNVGGTLNRVAGPSLHGSAVDLLPVVLIAKKGTSGTMTRKYQERFAGLRGVATYAERHPGDGFMVRDLRPLDELQGQGLVVEFKGEDGSRSGPRPDHQVMFWHLG